MPTTNPDKKKGPQKLSKIPWGHHVKVILIHLNQSNLLPDL